MPYMILGERVCFTPEISLKQRWVYSLSLSARMLCENDVVLAVDYFYIHQQLEFYHHPSLAIPTHSHNGRRTSRIQYQLCLYALLFCRWRRPGFILFLYIFFFNRPAARKRYPTSNHRARICFPFSTAARIWGKKHIIVLCSLLMLQWKNVRPVWLLLVPNPS